MTLYSAYLNDSNVQGDVDDYFRTVAQWSRENCKSFLEYGVCDVSDLSTQYDWLAQYYFKDKQDLVAFKLRWQ